MAASGGGLAVGQILVFPHQWGGNRHEKIHVLVNIETGVNSWCTFLLINTRPSTFVTMKPALLEQQIDVTPADIPGLEHDSVIGCDAIQEYTTAAVLKYARDNGRRKGCITKAVADKIVAVVQASKTLDQFDKDTISENLATIR